MWIIRLFSRFAATIIGVLLLISSFLMYLDGESSYALVTFIIAFLLLAWSARNRRMERYREIKEAMY